MPLLLVECAIEPRQRRDFEDFEIALNRIAAEDDDGFDIMLDRGTLQTVVRGVSEQQLARVVDLMDRRFGIAVNVGAPQVSYRETLGRKADIDYTHKKQSGGSGEFARIKLTFQPGEPGSGYSFENKVVGGSVPKEFIPGVEKGLEASRETGVLAGFPVIDFKVTLTDGNYHDVDSSVRAFEAAARGAFKESLVKAQCKLLEPVMKVDITAPNDCVSAVVGDLKLRRAEDLTIEPCRIGALVPLANMLGYAITLEELTAKRGAYEMVFDRYALVSPPRDDGPFRPAIGMRA
jgi:elongation factor G